MTARFDGAIERTEVEPGRCNVYASFGAPVVTLSTYMDTVPPFLPSREDAEFIWGRGACDTKGIIAAMIAASEKLLGGGVRDFALLFVVGEERNSAGAYHAAANLRGSKYLVNGEPTENQLAIGSKGALRYELVAHGMMAHSAYPELGESAIEKLLDVLESIRRIPLPSTKKPVQVARRTFRLLFEDEYRDGFSTFRIAQITRNAAGAPELNPHFVAPCLNLGSSPYLNMLLRRQIEILTNKSATLSGPRRQRVKITAEFLPSETANFWLLHTVNSHLPEIRHIWKVRRGHPEFAYVSMLRLAGALATFSLEARPENLPDYDHNDLGRCFTLLDRNIRGPDGNRDPVQIHRCAA